MIVIYNCILLFIIKISKDKNDEIMDGYVFFCLRDSDKKTKTYHGVMVLQGSQVQFHSAKQIANSWILHSAAAAACAKQKKSKIIVHIYIYII